MSTASLPSASYLRECFIYEPNTGILRWKERPASHFATRRAGLTWLKRWAGKVAGCPTGRYGYLSVSINSRLYKVHRVIWLLQTGHEPIEEIDHINGNPVDNRWINLREATKQQNQFNSRSGHTNLRGVRPYRMNRVFKPYKTKRYAASASINGKITHLGVYDTAEEAHAAWCDAVRKIRGEFFKAD